MNCTSVWDHLLTKFLPLGRSESGWEVTRIPSALTRMSAGSKGVGKGPALQNVPANSPNTVSLLEGFLQKIEQSALRMSLLNLGLTAGFPRCQVWLLRAVLTLPCHPRPPTTSRICLLPQRFQKAPSQQQLAELAQTGRPKGRERGPDASRQF